mgnify:CR=1 FL=1
MRSLERYSDEELIGLIARDDEKAFEALFDRYWEVAHSIACSKLRSREEAQEIVDDLFLDFWQRRQSLNIDNFRNYLYVAIKYKVITYIKQQLSRDQHYLNYLKDVPLEGDTTLHSIEYEDLMNALEKGMQALPEKTQEAFKLSRLEGNTVSETAKQLHLSEKAVEYHITRSRKELRLYLKDFLVLATICFQFLIRF